MNAPSVAPDTGGGLFVTGTDTGVGKTLVAAALAAEGVARGLTTAVMKPVAAGCQAGHGGLRNEDALLLASESNVEADYDLINPVALEPAIAPHIAALEAGVDISFEPLDRAFRTLRRGADLIVVEGAGGFLVPLAPDHGMADLPVRWQLPVILVVGMRLGCLNHALLTAEAISSRGLQLAGWVANGIDAEFQRLEQNLATLDRMLGAPRLGWIPHLPSATPTEVRRYLELDPIAALPGQAQA